MEPVRTGRNMRYSWDDYRKAVAVRLLVAAARCSTRT